MTGCCVELRGNCVTLISMCCGLLVGVVVGVRSSERKSRQGREAWEKGLNVVRKVVMVLIGMGMVVVSVRRSQRRWSCMDISGFRGFCVMN